LLLDFDAYLAKHKCIRKELPSSNGTRRFELKLEKMIPERKFDFAILEIPSDFANSEVAKIRLPKNCALNIPHVESDGLLCIGGDPGPSSGASLIPRLYLLLDSFYYKFYYPWLNGDLDADFEKEAMNYWSLHCNNILTSLQPIKKIYTVDNRTGSPVIYKSTFFDNDKIVIAGKDSKLRERYIASLGKGDTVRNVLVAEVPISYPFTPINYPKHEDDIYRLLKSRKEFDNNRDFKKLKVNTHRKNHRIVIFKAPGCSFGYLLPGGPPVTKTKNRSTQSTSNNKLIPLKVERLDLSWITGRDQLPEHIPRQNTHVLVIGVGALGSPVVEQLAKSGVGKISIVDYDNFNAANMSRHSLGADSIGISKVKALSTLVNIRSPSCSVIPYNQSIRSWLDKYSLDDIDVIIDLTGEPEVRLLIDNQRRYFMKPFLISWMEPYVTAAHACLLPIGSFWLEGADRLESLQAVEWPDNVYQREPSCSSQFQSYTSSAALYSVGLTTEAALDLIDGNIDKPIVRHWIRGKDFLDEFHPELKHRDWATVESGQKGMMIEREL